MSPEEGDTNDSGRGEPCPSARATKERAQGQPAVPGSGMVALGLSLVSPEHGRVAGMGTRGWQSGGHKPQPPLELQTFPKPPSALRVRNLVPHPPVPGRVLGHAGDSQGRWHSPGWLLSLPVAPAAQGLARSPRGIFILEFVLFEAVSSVFSVINTNPPLSQPGSELTATATPSAATA